MNKFEEIAKVCGELMAIDSPTGYTNKAMDYVEKYVTDLGLVFAKNNKGLGYCYQKDESKNLPLGLVSHVDTIGLMVKAITSDGKLKFTTIGGINLGTLDGEYCNVITKSGKVYRGTVLCESASVHVYKDAKSTERTRETMYIRLDELVKSKEDCVKLGIGNGDFIAIDTKFDVVNGFIKSRFLDDKLCVAQSLVLLKERLEKGLKTPFVYFSVYEEVGHGFSNVPMVDKLTEILALDMGCVGLDLEGSEDKVSICAMDGSGPYDYDFNQRLINLCQKNNITFAYDYYEFYSSDGSAALRSGNDVRVALIGAGIHASHGMERTHKDGVIGCYDLINLYLDIL
ncbi:MAG: M42 family metallopeptidase [Lachnospirales bacterium]